MDRAMMDEEKDKKSVTGDALRIRRHQTNMFAFDRCAVEFRGDTKEAITDVIIISCTVIRIIMKGGGRWWKGVMLGCDKTSIRACIQK